MSENRVLWSTAPGDGEELPSLSSGIKDDCFHCSQNPDKFLPLPKEKQPYCTRCFESMFNFDSNVNNNNNNNKPPYLSSQPPPSLPKPPAFKPPEIPPKPSGKTQILYSTLPQPFHPKSATPSISPVPSSTRSLSCTPPPSPPSECEADHRFYEGTNVDLSLPPPPPPLLETNLDSLESERNSQSSPYSSSSPSSGSARLGAYSPALRYDSPTPIQINGHQDQDFRHQANVKTASNNSSNLPTSPLPSRTSPPSKDSEPPPDNSQSNLSGPKKTSTLKGGGQVKFDYKLIAAVPSAMADWRDPEEDSEKEAKTQRNNSPSSSSSLSSTDKDSLPSKYYRPELESSPILGQSSRLPRTTITSSSYSKSSSPVVNTGTSVKQSPSPPIPPPQPLSSPPPQSNSIHSERVTSRTPGFQGIRPGPGSWSSARPAATIGAAINRAAGIDPPVKSTPPPSRTLAYESAKPTLSPPTSRTVTSMDPPKSTAVYSNRPSGLRPQLSTEPEESHLDQINSIFKMGSMKPKPIDPYAGPEEQSPAPSLGGSKNVKPVIASNKPSLKCAKCSCNLLGKTVQSNSKGEFVCAPCYKNEQTVLAGCVKCGGEFTPENHMVTYKAQGWHHKCFACDKCTNPIGTKTFCKQPEGLYCSDCYFETKGRICVKCKTYLKSTGFIFRNQPWHHECFLCHACQKRLGDEEIYCKDESPYCAKCYDQNFTEKCAKCFKVLSGETVEYESSQYHDECFCCFQCTRPIGSASFFPREGQVYCDVCFTRKFAKTCKQCQLVISPTHGAGLVYKEQHFHKDCFNCTHCHKHLGNNMVHSTKTSDDPFCENCYDELFAKRCTSCTNIISGVIGTRFMSYQGRHWHVECFNCKLCQTSLENRKFVPSQGEMLCIACSKFNPYSQIT